MIKGKIYKIVSKNTDMIYIGSTKKKFLNERFCIHKWDKNMGMLKSAHLLFIWDDAEIQLLEKYDCNTRTELRMREQEWMDKYTDYIVNTRRAYNSPEYEKKRHKKKNERFYSSSKGIEYRKKYDAIKCDWISSMGGWTYGLTLIKV